MLMGPQDFIDMKNRIIVLEAQVKQLSNSQNIPRNVETSLTQRLPFLQALTVGTPTATASPTSVPIATKTLRVTFQGATFNLLSQ